MHKNLANSLRKLLRENKDGMNTKDLSDALGRSVSVVRTSLSNMPDAYIDRWEIPDKAPMRAIWCVVDVPENCPKPKRKSK